MGRALVLKNVNFSANKLDTVNIMDDIPCTNISLSQNAITFTKLGAETLTAVVTPSDTTDIIVWSTSDNSVATVLNGVVTAVGLGTATITATCGSQSATCSVSVSVSLSPSDLATFNGKILFVSKNNFNDDGMDFQKLNNGTEKTIVVATTDQAQNRAFTGNDESYVGIYPIKIPQNANTMTIGIESLIQGITICYMDSTKKPTYQVAGIQGARVVYIPSTSWSSHPTVTIPDDVDGLDSVLVTVTFKENTSELPSGFEITFA